MGDLYFVFGFLAVRIFVSSSEIWVSEIIFCAHDVIRGIIINIFFVLLFFQIDHLPPCLLHHHPLASKRFRSL